jgi:hypothetical protein
MRLWILVVAVAAMALAIASVGRADNATVTRATLASGFFDGTTFYPATCDETQVINDNGRTETFNCTFDAAVPAPNVCDTSIGCVWFSDFDGAEATSTHFVVTPSGRAVGWAQY